MRILASVFIFIVVFLSFQTPTHAAIDCRIQRCAECDECGYCYTTGVQPDGWDSCRKCLYPDVNTAATDNETLRIITDISDPALLVLPENRRTINKAVPPAAGKYYTQLGCIDTNLASFSDPSASGGVLNFLLGSLIFPSVGVLTFLALIYGSFLLITAQGEQMKIEKGKRVISGAIIGLVFTFGSILLVTTIGGDILRIPGIGRSDEIVIDAAGSIGKITETNEFVYVDANVMVNGTFVKKLSAITGNIDTVNREPSPDDYLPYNVSAKVTSGDVIKIDYINDVAPANLGIGDGDVNLYIMSIKVNGDDCINPTYYNRDNTNFFPPGLPVSMNWPGYLTCTAP